MDENRYFYRFIGRPNTWPGIKSSPPIPCATMALVPASPQCWPRHTCP